MTSLLGDDDEWEVVPSGERVKGGIVLRRRTLAEVTAVKADRRRQAEDYILARADAIRRTRAAGA